MDVQTESKFTVVKAAGQPLNHLVPLKNQLLLFSLGRIVILPEKLFRIAKANKKGHRTLQPVLSLQYILIHHVSCNNNSC